MAQPTTKEWPHCKFSVACSKQDEVSLPWPKALPFKPFHRSCRPVKGSPVEEVADQTGSGAALRRLLLTILPHDCHCRSLRRHSRYV